jgi:hypothetical protein
VILGVLTTIQLIKKINTNTNNILNKIILVAFHVGLAMNHNPNTMVTNNTLRIIPLQVKTKIIKKIIEMNFNTGLIL